MQIKVDGKTYESKKAALQEFFEAMLCCDGSEGERMTFAYCAIENGATNIDTYKGIAE